MLKLQNIVKDYVTGDTTVRALKGVSLSFRRNEFVSILGPSGCGKTTLLNIIGGLDQYTSGDLFIEGKSTKTFKAKDWDAYRNRCIGFVFQNYNLIPHLTVLGNVEMALTLSGVSKSERKRMATAALEKVGLKEQVNKRPNQLSGGQMQRVAIARALVNDPEVILADEPTGALDSVTSVQISDLLQEIAKDRLVIMVTHNRELAEKYSTRIIEVLDGEVVADSNPYEETEEELAAYSAPAAPAEEIPRAAREKKNKTSMSYGTALSLSFKNLITKKGRTFMTSFAGSIGIIGIALVLAISNGFTHYIDKMQSDTLSGYPLSIAAQSVDVESAMDSMQQGVQQEKFPNDPAINVQYPSNTLFHTNVITNEFIDEYVKELEPEWYNTISYSYSVVLNVLALDENNVPRQLKAPESHNPMDMMTGASASFWSELLEKDYVLKQYDVLAGAYPEDENGLVLVVDKYNRISSNVLEMLNIDPNGEKQLDFQDILGQEFKLVSNNDFYELKDGIYQPRTVDRAMYDKGKALTVTGILRIKENASMELFGTGLMYTPELTQQALASAKDSEIAKAQVQRFADGSYQDVRTGKSVFEKFKNQLPDTGGIFTIDMIAGIFLNNQPEDVVKMLATAGVEITLDEVKEIRQLFEHQKTQTLQELGAEAMPASIQIYPKNFESKEKIKAKLAGYNTDKTKNEQIVVTDMAAILTDTMTNMVDIISYVLVAFAAVSLIVSSIMIGIITYVSVIERTKEIGVLRSLGARKKDISRVFNAETLIIGLAAGLIGVFVAFILTFPINAIITHLASGMVTNMALLNPLHALLLVVISMALTLISGFIPSRIAAKRDPVVALRSE